MLSALTLLFAALLMPSAADSRGAVERGPSLPPPSFCAELETPPLLAIAVDEEDFMLPEEEQGCSDSDVLQPYDIEAPVDTI
jgi:hypothetical protein